MHMKITLETIPTKTELYNILVFKLHVQDGTETVQVILLRRNEL